MRTWDQAPTLQEMADWALAYYKDAKSIRVFAADMIYDFDAPDTRSGPRLNFSDVHLRKLMEAQHALELQGG